MKLEQFEKIESQFFAILERDYPERDINLCYDVEEEDIRGLYHEETVDYCKIMGHQEGDEEIGALVFETVLQDNLLLPEVDYKVKDIRRFTFI